jgi:hypothetical protein
MRQRASVTEKKYAAFINDCYEQKTFDLRQLLQKHRVDGSLISTLSSMDLVVSVRSGVYNWVGDFPLTPNSIELIIYRHRERAKAYRLKREEKVILRRVGPVAPGHQEPTITEQQAVDFLKSIGGYEIYKVERKQV